MPHTTVMSLGGSIVVPDSVDTSFVAEFVSRMKDRLARHPDWHLAIVIGGGATARRYQEAARTVDPGCAAELLDTIGVAATRLNAQIVRAAFGSACTNPLVSDPTDPGNVSGRVLVAGGWKPGFSTDNVAVRLAETLGSNVVVNLSNVRQIHTADPRIVRDARPLDRLTWSEFFKIAGDEWTPGKNTPFDPVASRRASSVGMTVVAADGRDLDNLDLLLDGRPFVGTTIGPA